MDPEKAMQVDKNDENDDSSGDEEIDSKTASVASQLLKNPAVMAALQGKLDGMVGRNSGYIQTLPAPVKRRIKALKKLQLEATKIEAKFYEEIHQLECKYLKMYQPLYDQRTKITTGAYEPKDEECEWPSDEEEEELAEDMKDKVKLNNSNEKASKEGEGDKMDADAKGIPEFWLTIFKNVDMLQDMVQEHDEPALKALTDITVTFAEKPMGFTLHFHFDANDYFSDQVLTKEYFMKCEPSEDDPFGFEGPEIFRCKGCPINWKQGKNLTVKTVKKKQKHKAKGSVRTVTKTMKNDSFFNFFDPPAIPEDESEIDEETQELLTSDFEIGHYIRERIVPRAVLFFTGEALDEEDDYDEEEEEEEEGEGDEEEDEDNDPDFDPSKAKGGEKPQECKQQ